MTPCLRCGSPLDPAAVRCSHCGADVIPIAVRSSVPVTIDGRYIIERELGHGGMGVVYLARDTGLDRPVALKLITPEAVGDATTMARFRREAAMLAAVRSDHIVQVFAFGVHEGSYFFVMEYVRGSNLAQIIRAHARHGRAVHAQRAVTVLRQIARGLGAIHDAGILHRDVKPANILIEPGTGRPVLIDFGLARSAAGGRPSAAVGTPAYVAPEQLSSVRGVPTLTPASDVYALACAGFELLTGELPYQSETLVGLAYRHLREPIPSLSDRRSELAPFDAVFTRAMAKDPHERYEDGTAFAEALDAAARAIRPPSLPPPPSTTATPTPRPNSLHVLIVDDDPIFRTIAAAAAKRAAPDQAVRITSARRGAEAVETARKDPPHLLILDFSMPGLNGIETLAQLHDLPRLAGVKILVVSERIGAAERGQFSLLGVQDFVSKPVEPDEFVAVLGALLSSP